MKSDIQLQRDITDELSWQPNTRDTEIGVAVRDGVVTLSGTVSSFAQKLAAERAAERVSGVRAIAEELEVKLPGASTRTDTEIAHQVINALRWDIEVPDQKIRTRVEDGWVTVEGTVEFQYQKAATARAVRNLTGVRGLTDLIEVKPTNASPFDVSQKIKDALRRSAELDADRITVEAHDGTVTLSGRVHSWADRREAERAAWSAPGVTYVEDRMTVIF